MIDKIFAKIWISLKATIIIFFSLFFLGGSTISITNQPEIYRKYTRQLEFDYIAWLENAIFVKSHQAAINPARYLPPEKQEIVIDETLQLTHRIDLLKLDIERDYISGEDKKNSLVVKEKKNELERSLASYSRAMPFLESILQQRISAILEKEGVTLLGQPIPPVLFHVTPLPLALIVSPRNKIEQTANISLNPSLSIDDILLLEENVQRNVNVSALVVPIGGVGIYPTMVMSSTDLNWLVETVAHEWAHNYLTLRPLGILYDSNQEMRTINETVASIFGTEVNRIYTQNFSESPPEKTKANDLNDSEKEKIAKSSGYVFNYQKEMQITRVKVDQLLKEERVNEAESYMEERRKEFWANGYQIRKINQAYFAFYGAYADQPGGAAGDDPVGPAVNKFRENCSSLGDFINKISWITSFAQLKEAID